MNGTEATESLELFEKNLRTIQDSRLRLHIGAIRRAAIQEMERRAADSPLPNLNWATYTRLALKSDLQNYTALVEAYKLVASICTIPGTAPRQTAGAKAIRGWLFRTVANRAAQVEAPRERGAV